MNQSNPDVSKLAITFIESLVESLDASAITKINKLNSSKEYEGVCASHDFCDANQVMSDALRSLGFDYHPGLNDVINQAWEKAKGAQFSTANLLADDVVKLATVRREFLDQYNSDLTYVVLDELTDSAVIRPLHFPDREPFTVPKEHLNVFDEIDLQDEAERRTKR